MKICLIRLDKIGDLVSTLPVDQIPELAGHEVKWVIAQGLGFLPSRSEPNREFVEIPLLDPHLGQQKLRTFLEGFQPDLAVFFYGPWWVSKVLWQARVPKRFGRRSQWHSYLFLNVGLRQSRSLGERHEADYNLELLQKALGTISSTKSDSTSQIKSASSSDAVSHSDSASVPASFSATPSHFAPPLQSGSTLNGSAPVLILNAPSLRHLFEKFDLRSNQYFVVHAGMAGSALNWPEKHYVTLIENLAQEKEVVLTGTAADEIWLAPLKKKFAGNPRVLVLQGQLSMDELLFILKNSSGVVAPSTGVLHLAASLGVPSVGVYSPIPSQHPKRWGPRGPRTQFLLSPVPDLESITPEQVIACLKSL